MINNSHMGYDYSVKYRRNRGVFVQFDQKHPSPAKNQENMAYIWILLFPKYGL